MGTNDKAPFDLRSETLQNWSIQTQNICVCVWNLFSKYLDHVYGLDDTGSEHAGGSAIDEGLYSGPYTNWFWFLLSHLSPKIEQYRERERERERERDARRSALLVNTGELREEGETIYLYEHTLEMKPLMHRERIYYNNPFISSHVYRDKIVVNPRLYFLYLK